MSEEQEFTSLKDFLLKGRKKSSLGRQVRRSKTFLQNRIKDFSKQTKRQKTSRPGIGHMYLFQYQAKHDGKLPYWDRFPLILGLGPSKKVSGAFLGLNLHYLPPRKRVLVLDKLIAVSKLRKISERSKLKISYGIVKSASKYYKVATKMYLYSHLKSSFIKINPEEWHEVVLLPLANFKGAPKTQVYKDSNSKA